ncbi:hypothetical protein [Azorhizophilus paspali]|uniref:Lysozyme inhibitor LprI N-terminal domain-containing protein n=1 Tax=Azorhizophilus paspali TaxID=69963 RepID=A0ABV6SN02_AZOPA
MKAFIASATGVAAIVGGIYLHEQARQENQELYEQFASSMVARHDGMIWNAQMGRVCDLEFDGRSGDEGIRRYLACEKRMLNPAELRKSLALSSWLKTCSRIEDFDLLTKCFAQAVDQSVEDIGNARTAALAPEHKGL